MGGKGLEGLTLSLRGKWMQVKSHYNDDLYCYDSHKECFLGWVLEFYSTALSETKIPLKAVCAAYWERKASCLQFFF